MRPGGQCLLVFVAQCPVFTMYERMANTAKWGQYMLVSMLNMCNIFMEIFFNNLFPILLFRKEVGQSESK